MATRAAARMAVLATRPANRPARQVALKGHARFVKSSVQCAGVRFKIPPEADGSADAQLQH